MSFLNNLNNADILVLLFTLASMLYGYVRGLFKETLSIVSLFISGYFSLEMYPIISVFLKKYIEMHIIADGVSLAILFVLIYSVVKIIINLGAKQIKNSSLEVIDKNFGILFGLIRAFVILSLIYVIFIWTIWKDGSPIWVKEAQTTKIINSTSNMLLAFVPEKTIIKLQSIFGIKNIPNLTNNTEDKQNINKYVEPLLDKKNKSSEGYSPNDNESLDQLFNIENNE